MRLPWKRRPISPVVPTTVVARFVMPGEMMARDSYQIFTSPNVATITLNVGDDFGAGKLSQGDVVEVTAQMVSSKVTFMRKVVE